jgi:flagellar basal-body rod modification protein FlgD
VFLNLLVAQLKNQDPMNPTDSTQFVSQLAQFSELEQVIGIRGDIETQLNGGTATTGTTATEGSTKT